VNYTFDSADRPSTATDSANGITYATDWQTPPTNTNCVATAVCYTPQGSVYGMSIGQTTSFTGFNFSETYNNRLQPGELKASSSAGSAIDITYNFVDPVSTHNAGHVYGITNNLNSSRSQAFTYDQVNRIVSASTTATTGTYCWGYQYTYDAWGNLNAQAGSSGYSGCSEYTSSATAGGNNQLTGLSYDASGNTLSDGSYSYTWNAESQMKTAAGVTYAYDGDGRRAAKVGSTLHWYGSGGEVLSETDTSGNTQNEYIFFGGKRVALVPASGSVLYYAEDMLGSSRVMVESSGTLCYDADFTPFGAERDYTSTCAQNYKFEGKERDPETLNDDFGARKYTWRFGRWLSSDWSAVPVAVPYANLTNPQTLNLYAMVADDPESFDDLDGHDPAGAMQQAGPSSTKATVAKQTTTQQQAQQQQQAQNKSWWQKALSYFYVKTGNGKGFGVKDFKLGPVKVDAIERSDGKDVKQTTAGKTVTTVNSQVGVKVDIGPVKLGVERTNSQEDGQAPKTEWVPGFEMGKFEGSGSEIGVGAGGCFVLCGQVEVGVQGDKVWGDVKSYVTDPGPPPAPPTPGPPQ
jgi:RHS repeat-associated protein